MKLKVQHHIQDCMTASTSKLSLHEFKMIPVVLPRGVMECKLSTFTQGLYVQQVQFRAIYIC